MEIERISLRRGIVIGLAFILAIGGTVVGANRSEVGPAPGATRPGDAAVTERGAAIPGGTIRFSRSAVAIPVLGVTAADLRDTFGEARSEGRVHEAIDILVERGTPVVAAVTGSIIKLYQSGAGGTTIYLSDQEGEIVYYYAHLDRYVDGLSEGDLVERGQIIGYVGTTGNAPANAPHLHFSIEHLPATGEWWKGKPINPYPILVANGYTVR